MNLADFFSPSLERGASHGHRALLLRMPPRNSKDAPLYDVDAMGPMLDMHPILARTTPASLEDRLDRSGRPSYNGSSNNQLERIDSREKSRRDSMTPRPTDVTFYVGCSRAPYTLSAESLKHSTYFASLLEKRIQEPIVLDCEETIFQHIVLILRYGTFEALPKMSESELFRLKRELECYGIDVPEATPRKPSPPSAPSTPFLSSASSSPSHRHFSHASQSMLQHPSQAQMSQQVHHSHQHAALLHHPTSMTDFPDLPDELRDASKMVLVARMDDDEKGRCPCTPKDQHTYWALSFHHRHTFCTGCGKCPTSMSPRFLAEMYMAAAMYYSSESFSNKQKWSVGCDSTCSLKLLTAKPCCLCPCSRKDKCCGGSNGSPKATVWAASTYHSHAFCTHCGEAADDRTLICILLTLRYGGISKHSKRRERATAYSEGVIAQESRTSGSSRGSELPSHSRGNRSL